MNDLIAEFDSLINSASTMERRPRRVFPDFTADAEPHGPPTQDRVLTAIVAEYRPYDTLDAFGEGFAAYQVDGPFRENPYDDDAVIVAVTVEEARRALPREINAQAWDRGANAAMRYRRALQGLPY